MFDERHYLPILRWKRGEWRALRELREADRTRLTPVLEMTPKAFSKWTPQKPAIADQLLIQTVEELRKSWGTTPAFIDLSLIDANIRTSGGQHPIGALCRLAEKRGVHLIPVTGLRRSSEYQRAIRQLSNESSFGACLRLYYDDLQLETLPEQVEEVLNQLGAEPKRTDLLVDYQVLGSHPLNYKSLCSCLPNILSWRTFTVASGAFPKDLSEFKIGQHQLSRQDWLAWRNQVAMGPPLPRRPTYSDYTTQHATFSEPPKNANFSASIRYTSSEHWIIMRGEGVFNDDGPGFAQWPANAQLLCCRPEFCGADFSYGDTYIERMSRQTMSTGSAETWLRAGVNHHMTFVVRQLTNLFET